MTVWLDTLGLISGDSHVNEPRRLWSDNLPRSLRSKALRGIKPGSDGNWDLVMEGEPVGTSAESEPDRMRIANPEHRYQVMRAEGIVAECIYPSIGLYVWQLPDPVVGAASCRVYNEWIADGLARRPRFKCAGLIPSWRLEDAVAEVAWVSDSRLGAIMLPAVASPDWNHRQWEPLWSAIDETALPVVMHQGTGHSMYFYRGPGAGVSNLVATQSMAPRTATLLATSGVLAGHPGMHVVLVEFNCGWMAWAMDTADFYTRSFSRYGYTPEGKKWVNPDLPELPSFYMRRQVHSTFQDDPVGIDNMARTGAAGLIWGSDYPHEEGTYPKSRETVSRLAERMDSREDIEQVFRTNAADLFHFSPEVLNRPL
jgi:predicted TIM-barrel fold metal-dependent hydrolase